MKFKIEMNVYELHRSITAGTLEALVKDVQASEDEARQKPVPEEKPVEAKKEAPAEKVATKAEEKTVEPDVTEVELRAKFVELSKKGKRTELKSLLEEIGVEKVSDLKPEQYQEAMTKLEAI